MKIKKMFLENLYSYEKMDFSFDNFPGGTTLLLGKNLDQKTSNGSGKSTILKALFFGLYGEDVNGAVKAAVLRRGSSWYSITIEFEDKGHFFKIERFEGKKDKTSPGKGLNFYIDNALFNGDGIEQTQKIINQKIKITPRLFLSSIYAAQDASSNFLLESDTNKKELLTELLDLSIYQKAFIHIKKEIDDSEKDIIEKQKKIDGIKEQISELDAQVKEFSKKRDTFNQETKKEIEEEIKKGKLIALSIDEIKLKIIPKFNLEEIVLNLERLKKERTFLENETKNESSIKVNLEKINTSINSIDEKNKDLEKEIEKFENELIELEKIKIDENLQSILIDKKNNIEIKLSKIDILKKELENVKVDTEIKNMSSSFNKKELLLLEEERKNLIEGRECPTCHRQYSFDENHDNHIKIEIEKIDNKIKAIQEEILNLHEFILKNSDRMKKISQEILEEDSLKKEVEIFQTDFLNFQILIERVKIKDIEKEKIINLIKEKKETVIGNINFKNDFSLKKIELEKLESENLVFKQKLLKIDEEISKESTNQLNAEVESTKIKSNIEQLEKLQKERLEKIEKIQNLRKKHNPYGEMILNIEKRSAVFVEKIDMFLKQINKIEEDLKYFKFWQIGFAPTGIRSFITDDVIELLNRKTQENLNDLFDGALSVFFDPESKNKKGVISNKISTHFYLNGKETVKETLSGGELRRAILATELALTEIAESRSGNKLNVRFLDEPFNGIDSNGQLQTFKLFARLAKDKDGFFVISHDENFQNMCPNVIYVLKKNEVSKIVSKETYERANIKTDKQNYDEDQPVLDKDSLSKDKNTILAEKLKNLKKK